MEKTNRVKHKSCGFSLKNSESIIINVTNYFTFTISHFYEISVE